MDIKIVRTVWYGMVWYGMVSWYFEVLYDVEKNRN